MNKTIREFHIPNHFILPIFIHTQEFQQKFFFLKLQTGISDLPPQFCITQPRLSMYDLILEYSVSPSFSWDCIGLLEGKRFVQFISVNPTALIQNVS